MTSSSSPSRAGGFAFEQLAPPPPPEPPPPAPRDLDDAQAEGDAIVAAAHDEAERIRAQAHLRGYEEGSLAAAEEAGERLTTAASALAAALADVDRLRGEVVEEVEREAVSLSLLVAEKVVAGALAVQPERVIDVLRGALRCLVVRERVVVLVNPGDLDMVRDAVQGLVGELGGIEHLEVQEERRVPRGGAVVRAPSGEVDAKLEVKLGRASEVFERELAARAGDEPAVTERRRVP